MKRNGFTLIELLAVIVVLAIIALIATPIVLNIINNAKTSSNERSGELYVKAVENAIIKKQMSGTDVVTSGTYTVQSDGSICIVSNNVCESGTTITIDVEGDVPTEGTITVSNGVVVSYNLVVSGTSVTKGESSDDSTDTICTLVSGTSKSEGAKYSCKVNDTDTFYFYVLGDEDDNYINLIMDRNICDDGTTSSNEKEDKCYVTWNTTGNNADGPVTALSYLNSATSTWTNITYFNDTNYILVDEGGNYSNISLSGYHARLLRTSDIYIGTELEFRNYLNNYDDYSQDYYDDSNNEDKYYLFDNMDLTCWNDKQEVSCDSNEADMSGVHKEGMTHISEIYRYWLSTTGIDNSYECAWVAANEDGLYCDIDSKTDEESVIRPVITVLKSSLN